jgi:PAS domain S-box-containing protein
MKSLFRAGFFRRIVVPALLAIILFIVTVFAFVIPAFQKSAMQQKQSMLLELTNTAWSILQKYHRDQVAGVLPVDEAQNKAIAEIEALRYGVDKKDYFWITDMEPAMIMHPYVQDLNGQSLSEFSDPDGKKLFIEARELARNEGEGFISYKWQFMDDSTNIVPKLSFVKVFEPWQWIIGTGVYIDDVEKEISSLTNKMILILVGISALISLIIFFITYQSLGIESKRREAEAQLHESREKYKSLVESSTEGIILLLNGRISYSNTFIQTWLQYSSNEMAELDLSGLLEGDISWEIEKPEDEHRMDVRLLKKDGSLTEAVMTILPVRFAEKEGLLLTFRDISEHVTVRTALEVNREMIQQIAKVKSLGIFQFSLDSKTRIMKYNDQLAHMLGYENPEELRSVSLSSILGGKSALKQILSGLFEAGTINSRLVKLLTKDKQYIDVRLSLFLGIDNGKQRYCNGIAEIAGQHNGSSEKEGSDSVWIPAVFTNNLPPLSAFYERPVTCPIDATIQDVLTIMAENVAGCVILMMNFRCSGIITRGDLLTRYFLPDKGTSAQALSIATSPVVTITDTSTAAEAYSLMCRNKISQLPVLDNSGKLLGIIYLNRLAGKYIDIAELGTQLLRRSNSVAELLKFRRSIPGLIGLMPGQTGSMESFSATLSGFNDAITNQIISNAIKEIGKPPVPFSFFSIGSAGRRELAFNSDQDNAIIYKDTEEIPETDLQQYFLALSGRICQQLDQSGLMLCKGGYMASNPAWCKPLSAWKNYFAGWIDNAEPENILKISVFFDFRHINGDERLFDELEQFVFDTLKGKTAFFYFLARNISGFRPGISKSGGILSDGSGKKSEMLDVKNSLAIVVMFVRIYALHSNIRLKGTAERAWAVYKQNVFSRATYDEVLFHYNFLMAVRLKNQLQQLAAGSEPDNMVEIRKLTEMEQFILKKVIAGMNEYDERLSAAFMSAYKG